MLTKRQIDLIKENGGYPPEFAEFSKRQTELVEESNKKKPPETYGLPVLTKEDLEEKEPYRLNELLRFLSEKLEEINGEHGSVTLGLGPYTHTGEVTFNEAIFLRKGARLENLEGLVYADNDAAKEAGLVSGDLYRKSTGEVMVVYDA
jgi:hypothetical protein